MPSGLLVRSLDRVTRTFAQLFLAICATSLQGCAMDAVAQRLGAHVASINIQDTFNQHLAGAARLTDEGAYEHIIRVFNHKGLVGRASQLLGIANPSYVVRARKVLTEPASPLADVLGHYMPVLDASDES